MVDKIDTYCGLSCEKCGYREAFACGGCVATNGNPCHGTCLIAECARERGRRFCGECAEFPCDLLRSYSEDSQDGDRQKDSRIERCRQLKLALAAGAREGINPVSCCGHHCDYCFFGKWCGGCRSGYNCCSYATLFDDGKCPNLVCADERGLNGCSECGDLDRCKKGYYSVENEYVAKAAAMFIRRHGEVSYTSALRRAAEEGSEYPGSFDGTGSVEGALKLLEQYL